MRRVWLIFSQTVTVALALWFVVATLKPQWLDAGLREAAQWRPAAAPRIVTLREEQPAETQPGPGQRLSYRDAAQRALPAVVSIATARRPTAREQAGAEDPLYRFFFGERGAGRNRPQQGLGSGVIVSSEGYVVTNFHVVEGMDDIEVALADGRRAQARLIGSDADTDLAVLRLDLPDLPAIRFGAADRTQVGDIVLAIGNPFGVGQTVTQGIVSALGRSDLGINTFENFIQTDAAINPGNSGGALVDTQGLLLGINTAIYSRSGGSMGIGFAIPASTVRNVLEQIVSHGQVVRGYLGVDPQALTPELAKAFGLRGGDDAPAQGVVIAGVLQNGPADRAGIKPGDVVAAIDGVAVRSVTELLNTVAALKPGSRVRVQLWRGAQEAGIDVTVGQRPKPRRGAEDRR